MLRQLKLSALSVLKSTGISGLVGRTGWRQSRLLILGYHGFALADEVEWNDALFLSEATLRRRFEAIRAAGCAVLSLEEGLQRLQAGTLPPRAVVLTFDDGFADFASLAYPLLREFRFPATLYLTTYYVDHQLPVFTVMLRYLLWKGRGTPLPVAGFGPLTGERPLRTTGEREAAFAELTAMADDAVLDSAARDRLLADVAARLGIDFDAIRASRMLSLVTPAEVAAFDPALVSVHLHTHRHRVPLDRALFTRELTDNAAAIGRITPRWAHSRHFCYPSGVTHPDFLPWLRELGIESATTCFSGMAERTSDPLMLPRLLDTTQLTDLEFDAWLRGVGALLPRRTLPGER
ncbi:MAG: polysaccharide deacetylase family protein [Gemmatimonadaceae bacterium]|nr:polysaccharide deacetylase family protein [Gemmatimonadaceae bacterium]